MKRPCLLFCVFGVSILVVSSCSATRESSGENNLKGNIKVSGAFAIYPLMTRWAEEFQRIHPGVSFEITSSGAGQGMLDVLDGKADIGMISREVSTEEKAKGAYPLPVGKDAVFPLVNEKNPVLEELLTKGVTRDTLEKIFLTREITTWGDVVGNPSFVDEVHLYTRADLCGAASVWGLYLGGTQGDLLGDKKWGDPGMTQALQKDPLGIGYNNLIYAYGLGDVAPQGTVILPIDLNENGVAEQVEILDTREKATAAIASGFYPAPPSRTLYLVMNAKPAGIVQTFLDWILTDGQVYVEKLGYVPLPEEQLKEVLQNIQ